MGTFELFLAEKCAPVLAGIKPGSLFPYTLSQGEDLRQLLGRWNRLLAAKGVRVAAVKPGKQSGNHLLYVYRPRMLGEILNSPMVAEFLRSCGYETCCSTPRALARLIRRFGESDQFPHEIGIFLGYPLHDVLGFIRHKGKNCLCSGCWKVYAEPGKAKRLFGSYRDCTRAYRDQLFRGRSVEELVVPA